MQHTHTIKELARLFLKSRQEGEDEGLHDWPERALERYVVGIEQVEKGGLDGCRCILKEGKEARGP